MTYANVTSTLALFAALATGTAYAANTVFSDDIADGQVKTVDLGDAAVTERKIADGAVTTNKVRDNNLRGRDLLDNTLTSADIGTGGVRTDELANGQVQAEDLAPGVAPGASGARAWGLVNAAGDLVRGKNVFRVTLAARGGLGVYCIDPGSGIDPTTAVMVVSGDFEGGSTSDGGDNISHIVWDSGPSDCPAGTMEVHTFIGDGELNLYPGDTAGDFQLRSNPEPFSFVIP